MDNIGLMISKVNVGGRKGSISGWIENLLMGSYHTSEPVLPLHSPLLLLFPSPMSSMSFLMVGEI